MKNVNELVKELFSGYVDDLITNRELGDMIDLYDVTNEYTVVVDNSQDKEWFDKLNGNSYSDCSLSDVDFFKKCNRWIDCKGF